MFLEQKKSRKTEIGVSRTRVKRGIPVFTHARQILSQKRSNVMPKNAEKILFCRENLPVINFKY